MSDYQSLPDDLPVPEDDGAADHLPGLELPAVRLRSSDGGEVDLAELGPGRTVLYVYPMTGTPGVALPEGWDAIPGARGCTPESCGFRDHFAELRDAGATAVFGLSTQDPETQRASAQRLALPFPLLSDPAASLGERLGLPVFEAGGAPRYRRITLVVDGGRIVHVFHPIFPPDGHAAEVLAWLSAHAVA